MISILEASGPVSCSSKFIHYMHQHRPLAFITITTTTFSLMGLTMPNILLLMVLSWIHARLFHVVMLIPFHVFYLIPFHVFYLIIPLAIPYDDRDLYAYN